MTDLLVLTTHTIQYQVPLFQYLTQEAGVDLHVAFMKEPMDLTWDQDFGRYVSWGIPLTDGYPWSTLSGGNLAMRLSAFVELHKRLGCPPVMMFSWGTPLHWLIWNWAIASRIPVLIVAESNLNSYQLGRRPLWRHLWLKQMLQKTPGILHIGQRNREFYDQMGVEKGHLFPCPYSIDNERFFEGRLPFLGERERHLKQLNLDPKLPTLLYSGKLIVKKRPDLLLQAVAEGGLRHQVNILFAGDGPLKNELMSLARTLNLENVAFLGFLDQAEMPMAYALGDCLCLLSDTPAETWGLVVNEAMACGRPVIVSNACGCAPDLVDGKGTGWIVPPANLAETVSVLRTAISQFESWPEIGARGRDMISKHTFARMSEGILAALAKSNRNK